MGMPQAMACIANGTTTVTIDCASVIVTTDTTNSTSANTSTHDRVQSFDANLVGTIQSAVPVSGAGLELTATGTTPHSIDMTNNGSVTIGVINVTGGALHLDGNGGAITYSGAGTVDGGSGNVGLYIANAAGNITFNGTGAISSGFGSGIYTQTTAGGVTTLNIANNVTGTGVFFGAVAAAGVNGATTVNMTAGTVTGNTAAIEASSFGTGGVRVNMTGGSIGTSAAATGGNAGIYAQSSGTAGDVYVTGGQIFAKYTGVYAGISNAASTGNVKVDANGAILVTTTPVTIDQGAIFATNAGSGATTVNVNAAVVAQGNDAVGVTATGKGGGAVTINVGADISAGPTINSRAVTAGGTNGTTTINMTSGTILTGGDALRATSLGTGNVVVNMTGGQIGGQGFSTLGGVGIAASNPTGASGAINVTAGAIHTSMDGIQTTIGNAANNSNTVITANGAIRAELRGISATSGAFGISARTAGTGSINITTNASVVGAQGVGFSGGSNNSLTNSATGNISTLAGISGYAVLGGTGNETVSNFGTINGIVDLGGGANRLTNRSSGLYNAGAFVVVGAGNSFTNSGRYAPGGTGTVSYTSVTGNFVQTSSGVYMVDVTPTASDKTGVSGTASLGGTVQATFTPGNYIAKSYTILSSNGRTGTFAHLNTIGLPSGFTASLSYNTTDAKLDLTASLGGTGGGGTGGGGTGGGGPGGGGSGSGGIGTALTQNQSTVATTLNNYFNAGNSLPAQFVTLFGLSGTSLANGLDQISGEVATGAPTAGFRVTDSFLNMMLDPFMEMQLGEGPSRPRAIGYASEPALPPAVAAANNAVGATAASAVGTVEQRWGTWAAAYGAQAKRNADTVVGSHALDARNGGGAAGVDYRLSADTIIGAAISGGFTNWGVDTLGSGRGETFQAGLYSSTKLGNGYVSAAVAYGWHDLSTNRTVMLPGAFDRLDANFKAQSYGGRVEAGYRIALMNFGITPYVAGQAQSFHTPAYTETGVAGAGGFALAYAAQTSSQIRSELGSRFDNRFMLDGGSELILRGRAAWLHDYSDRITTEAAFQVLPGTELTVTGAAPVRDAALVSLGSELRFARGFSLASKVDAELFGHGNAYSGTATLRYGW